MLQRLRQFSKSTPASIMMGLLSLAFVSWGIGDILQGHVSTAVATVGNTSIDQSDFQRDYNNTLKNMGMRRGKDISAEEAHREHLGDTLLQQTILNKATENVAARLGLTASDATVTTQIRSMQAFAGLNGTFDRSIFEQTIGRFNYSEKSFIEMMRGDLARAQLTNASESGYALPAGYARALLAFSSELRAAEYVIVDDKSLPPVAAPSNDVLNGFIKKHPDQYSTPEYRDVTYSRLAPEDVAGQVSVSEDLIKQAYENLKSKYVIEEKRTVERLSLQSEKDVRDARAKIAAGQSFADVAKAHGFAKADIDLGEVVAKDLLPDEAKAVFAVKQGDVTAPVKSTFGWSLFHVVKIAAGSVKTIDMVRDELKAQVQQELARAKLDDVSNAYTDAMGAGLSPAEAAKKSNLPFLHIAAIDRDGLTPDGSKAAAPDDAEFRQIIFNAEVGEEGNPAMTKAGVLYVIQVNGLRPPKLRPLDQVREKALAAWTAEQRVQLLKQRAADLAAKAQKEGSLAGIASATGATVQHTKAIGRDKGDEVFTGPLLDAFFAAMPGATVSGPSGKGGGYVIGRVAAVGHPLPPANTEMYSRYIAMLSQGVAADITASLAMAARDRQGFTINSKNLDSAIGKGEGS
jgi:peptidyl-prolyl cis-trans isomerase D